MIRLAEDQLNRKQFLNGLFSLFNNFGNQGNRGFTMIINGKFGSGKSTLLGFIEEQNEEKKDFNIVKYNAWENNLFESPLIPILYEISKLESNKGKIKEGAKNILKKLPKVFLSTLAGAHAVDFTPLLENENIFDEYDTYKAELDKFRGILTEYCKEKKVIFLIDELDRCLPEYQIKVLEAVYHLLEIPNLIVVIALDKEQLECSIKNQFGDAQNTLGYLAKFINYQVDLPDDNDTNLFLSLIDFDCEESEYVKPMIANMLKEIGYSVRNSQRIITEINLICNELDGSGKNKNYYYWYPLLIAMIVIIKYEEPKLYREYFGELKNEIYQNQVIPFSKSNYFKFLEEVKGSKLERLIKIMISNDRLFPIGQSFLIHFINAFDKVRNIDRHDISSYLNIDINRIDSLFDNTDRLSFPYSINNVIRKVKQINFQ